MIFLFTDQLPLFVSLRNWIRHFNEIINSFNCPLDTIYNFLERESHSMREPQGWPTWNYIGCVNWVGKTLPWAGQDCRGTE